MSQIIAGHTTKMEVALLLGLAALGYALAPQIAREQKRLLEEKKNPKETFVSPDKFNDMDQLTVVQSSEGHNNMVPFFGANVTQSTYSGATDGILDTYTGTGKNTFFHKEEAPAMFKPEAGTGLPWGRQVETDFEQSRQVTSLSMKNVFPIEQTQVGPGVNDGYTNLPSGGYQQDSAREFAMPRTTDEIRVANKPKLTYEADPVPGAHFITDMGLQAPVKKNRPDRFQVLEAADKSLPHVNTTMGQQVAASLYPSQVMKTQNRESTAVEYEGTAQAAAGGYLSYIRAFTEPFQEFMKLTVEGRPTPAGPAGGAGGLAAGPQSYNVQTHKDEAMLNNSRSFEAPLMTFGGQPPTASQQGSSKYVVPLQEDIYTQRNQPSILDAFKSNPYTQSLTSSA
jgi:hypothetical protein